MIIDAHCHLGDILYPEGGKLIGKRGVRKAGGLDLISISEASLHNGAGGMTALVHKMLANLVTRAERKRNAAATYENMRASMDANGVSYAACMPIPPYVTFDDLARTAQFDESILPFTGVDFGSANDVDISFQSPATIRKLLQVFGPERVLYASDWPYGNHRPAIKAVRKACRGDDHMTHMLLADNAARLLNIHDSLPMATGRKRAPSAPKSKNGGSL